MICFAAAAVSVFAQNGVVPAIPASFWKAKPQPRFTAALLLGIFLFSLAFHAVLVCRTRLCRAKAHYKKLAGGQKGCMPIGGPFSATLR